MTVALKVIVAFLLKWLRKELEEGLCLTGKPLPEGFELCLVLRLKRKRLPGEDHPKHRLDLSA